jgi:hypothetical protein
MTTPATETPPAAPISAGSRTITEIITDLSKQIDPKMLATRNQGGQELTYIPWHQATRLLDKYAPGWSYEITRESVTDGKKINNKTKTSEETRTLALTVRLIIPARDGDVSRKAWKMNETNS